MVIMQKTVIIVPCYNEAERLNPELFIKSTLENKNLSFIFVNDGSTDNTIEKITRLRDSNPQQIQYIDLDKNVGKAEAVRQGFLRALKTDVVNIGYWDADLATPLDAIINFCNILDNSKVAGILGSRVKLLGHEIKRGAIRHYAGRIFATFVSLILKLSIYDTQCGAKIFKKNECLDSAFKIPFKVNWTFDVELLARFILINKIKGAVPITEMLIEYPLEKWTDVRGSKVEFRDFLIAVKEVILITFLLYISPCRKRYLNALLGVY